MDSTAPRVDRHFICDAWQVLQQASQHTVVRASSIADVLAAHLQQDESSRETAKNRSLAEQGKRQSPASAHAELLSMWKARYPTNWGQQLTEKLASLLIALLNRQHRWQEVAYIFASQVDSGKVCTPLQFAPSSPCPFPSTI